MGIVFSLFQAIFARRDHSKRPHTLNSLNNIICIITTVSQNVTRMLTFQ